jgi:hypothetical protein
LLLRSPHQLQQADLGKTLARVSKSNKILQPIQAKRKRNGNIEYYSEAFLKLKSNGKVTIEITAEIAKAKPAKPAETPKIKAEVAKTGAID